MEKELGVGRIRLPSPTDFALSPGVAQKESKMLSTPTPLSNYGGCYLRLVSVNFADSQTKISHSDTPSITRDTLLYVVDSRRCLRYPYMVPAIRVATFHSRFAFLTLRHESSATWLFLLQSFLVARGTVDSSFLLIPRNS